MEQRFVVESEDCVGVVPLSCGVDAPVGDHRGLCGWKLWRPCGDVEECGVVVVVQPPAWYAAEATRLAVE
ncbi:hypothetical protein [Streptomyces sp. NPDC056452]|uniref:hypothetical protein n=1 Tax=Streptomyces sp. NPDC056452 TaxID=3345821 RepID=UPI0036B92A30